MSQKLLKFWFNEISPELVDPRRSRSMPYRQPKYRVEAIALKNTKKASKKEQVVNQLQLIQEEKLPDVQLDGPSSSTSTNLNFVPPPACFDDSD